MSKCRYCEQHGQDPCLDCYEDNLSGLDLEDQFEELLK